MKLDRPVEAADRVERTSAHGEVAPVENRAEAKPVMHERMRGRRDEHVVEPDERAPGVIPVVEPVRSSYADGRAGGLESPDHAFEPRDRCTTIRVDIRQDVRLRGAAGGFAGDDQALRRLVED